jgi:hypothetical protein
MRTDENDGQKEQEQEQEQEQEHEANKVTKRDLHPNMLSKG